MKKRFLVAAMAATMVSPLAAYAEATVYGNVHVSIDSVDSEDNLNMNSNTSAIGVKGKEDLGGGMSAIFKVEFQVDPTDRNGGKNSAEDGTSSLVDRDQWVGLKAAFGTVKLGTMTNNYKMMGGKIDPMYRTQLEGRGALDMQSSLHGGAGQNGGRSTNTLQYASPKMGGIQAVFNYTISGSDDETAGLGVHYETKNIIAFVDYLDVQLGGGQSEAAIKIGGSFEVASMTFGLQVESTEDALGGPGTGSDYVFASFNYQLNDNDNIAVTLGDADYEKDMGYAVMYNHNMSQRTNVYVGYGDNTSTGGSVSSGTGNDDQVLTVGMRHKF